MKSIPSVVRLALALVATATVLGAPAVVQAQNAIDEWANAKLPPPPQLKPVKIEAKETALLVMDFTNQTCSRERRPRCANQVTLTRLDLISF